VAEREHWKIRLDQGENDRRDRERVGIGEIDRVQLRLELPLELEE